MSEPLEQEVVNLRVTRHLRHAIRCADIEYVGFNTEMLDAERTKVLLLVVYPAPVLELGQDVAVRFGHPGRTVDGGRTIFAKLH